MNAPAFWKAVQRLFGPDSVTKKRVDGKPTHVFILPNQVEVERRFVEALGHSAEEVREILELGGSDVREPGLKKLQALRATAARHDALH
jgi:hypothetical protein